MGSQKQITPSNANSPCSSGDQVEKKQASTKKANSSTQQATDSKKLTTKGKLGKINNGESKTPKIKKEKQKKVNPIESPTRKKPKLTETKSPDNFELFKEHKKESSDEAIIKIKPVSKLKGK